MECLSDKPLDDFKKMMQEFPNALSEVDPNNCAPLSHYAEHGSSPDVAEHLFEAHPGAASIIEEDKRTPLVSSERANLASCENEKRGEKTTSILVAEELRSSMLQLFVYCS